MSPARVALATCAPLPVGDPDDAGLPGALHPHGIEATWAVWDDPAVDWEGFDLVVLRSPWDYTDRRDAFVAWAESLPRVRNAPDIVRWNTDKRYLAEVAQAGLLTVATTFVGPGEPPPALDGEVVVKPAVSAGARDTGRFGPATHDEARALIGRLTASGRTAMVQPYLRDVDARGETALLYFGGAFSHAAGKAAILEPDRVAPVSAPAGGVAAADAMYAPELITPRRPSAEERALGDRVLAHLHERFDPGSLLYARIDLLPGPEGPQVLELELTEPSLFLAHAEGALQRFAAAVAAALRR